MSSPHVCCCLLSRSNIVLRGVWRVFYQKIPNLTHLNHVLEQFPEEIRDQKVIQKHWNGSVLEHPFCSFRGNRKRSMIKKWSKNIETDHVLEHLFVVSELTGRDPWSKSDKKTLKRTIFWTPFVFSELTRRGPWSKSDPKHWNGTCFEIHFL